MFSTLAHIFLITGLISSVGTTNPQDDETNRTPQTVSSSPASFDWNILQHFQTLHSQIKNSQPTTYFKQYYEEVQHNAKQGMQEIYNNAEPFRKYGEVAFKLLNTISKKDMSKEEQVDTVVSALTDEIAQNLEESADIVPIEVSEPTRYICGSKGKLYDLRTIKHVKTSIADKQEPTRIYITYTFNKLQLNYKTFHVRILRNVPLTGSLDMKFGKNEMVLTIEMPRFSELITNIMSKNCILHIKDFNVNELEYLSCELKADSHFRKGLVSSQLDAYIKNHIDMLKKDFEVQVLAEVNRALAAGGDWICKDKGLADLIVSKGGSVDEVKMSKDFDRYCGSYH